MFFVYLGKPWKSPFGHSVGDYRRSSSNYQTGGWCSTCSCQELLWWVRRNAHRTDDHWNIFRFFLSPLKCFNFFSKERATSMYPRILKKPKHYKTIPFLLIDLICNAFCFPKKIQEWFQFVYMSPHVVPYRRRLLK